MAGKGKGGGRRNRTKPGAPGAEPGIGDNSGAAAQEKHVLSFEEQQNLFLHHRSRWNELQAKQAVVDEYRKDVLKNLKSDGFTKKEMEIADALMNAPGEAKIKAEVTTRLRVARFLGHPLGAQMDLFENPQTRDATVQAFEDGRVAGKEGRVRKPPYSPENPCYEQWMQGWYKGQEELGVRSFRAPDAPAPEAEAAH